ncbi:MAG: hypothetical protein QHJ73_04910, partial [Armatimonadota bacterium]|nr:hypothetical protein [Armatimonadota bacterium]
MESSTEPSLFPSPSTEDPIAAAADAIAADRPAVQTAAIAEQLQELWDALGNGPLGMRPDAPLALGICGGRLRIAFMHPDMGRFFGPAWQMPIGAGHTAGREQVVVALQPGDDGRIWLYPLNRAFREPRDWVAGDLDCMFPGPEVNDWYRYERFGTQMAESVRVHELGDGRMEAAHSHAAWGVVCRDRG